MMCSVVCEYRTACIYGAVHKTQRRLSSILRVSQERLWASWGDYDRRQFERVCKEQGVGYPFGISHLNVKTLFAVACGSERELGLDEAYARLGLSLEGTHHRGADDAWNIAGVLCGLLRANRDAAP